MFEMSQKPEIARVTPHTAEKWLNMNTIKPQRPLKPRLINTYSNKMRNGEFRTGEIAFAKLAYNGHETVLVNGQHTLNSIIVSGVTIDAKVEHYVVHTPSDLSLLYQQFDTYGGRSLGDLVRVEAAMLGIEWPPRICSLIVSGACLKENKKDAYNKEERTAMLRRYLEQGAYINEILNTTVPADLSKSKHCSHLMRSPVIHAMLCTWDRHQEQSKSFWMRVRDGENLKRQSPEYKLRSFLMMHSYAYGNGSLNGKRMVSHHEMTSKCITAWNAFRKGTPTNLAYYPTKNIPKAV